MPLRYKIRLWTVGADKNCIPPEADNIGLPGLKAFPEPDENAVLFYRLADL